jgi:polyhydroxybutyrate depolymerase
MTRARLAVVALAAAAGAAALTGCYVDRVFGVDGSAGFNVGTALHAITVGPLARSYELHVPTKRPTSSSGSLLPYPVLILLHGSSSSGDDIRVTTNMDSIADARHWVVAYPDAVKGGGGLFPSDWNAGTCCGAAGREDIDDVTFISNIITEISNNLPVDHTRIYVAGFSDGGRMAHRLGCELSRTVAAIAVVSGSLKDDACSPTNGVPIIAVHGTADDVVPYDDGSDTPPPGPVPDAAAALPPSMQFWVSQNGCGAAAVATTKPSTDVTRTGFTRCTAGDVVFYSVDGGVHTWPVLVANSDDPDSELSASAVIAGFLSRQVRK